MKKKQKIIIQCGPLTLFLSMDMFLIWMLKDDFEISLIIDPEIKENFSFEKIIRIKSIKSILYIEHLGMFSKIKNSNLIKKFVIREKPDKILTHSIQYQDNLNLIFWAKKYYPKIDIYTFQNGRWDTNLYETAHNIMKRQQKIIMDKNWYITRSTFLAYYIARFRNNFLYLINFKLIPFFCLQVDFFIHQGIFGVWNLWLKILFLIIIL